MNSINRLFSCVSRHVQHSRRHRELTMIATVFLGMLCGIQNGFGDDFTVIGQRPVPHSTSTTPLDDDIDLDADHKLAAGDVLTLGVAAQTDSNGNPWTFYWCANNVRIQSLNPRHTQIRFYAPVVAVPTRFTLVYAVTNSLGDLKEGRIRIFVTPQAASPDAANGQITATYNPSSTNFTVNYALDSSVSRAWILASTDGSNWFIASAIDPVTSANRNGARMVLVAGSGSVSEVRFRLRTQSGTSPSEEGGTISVSYTPVPPAPKSTELPNAPNLTINGTEVAMTSVDMFWQRVNDTLNRDNANFYEVQYAANPDFTGATLLNVGNTATGQNMYEQIHFTVSGLTDSTTYYFRVRAVNSVGAGPWSGTDSIRINVQDRPVFAAGNPVFPFQGATGVSKSPPLEFLCEDPDGDPLDYYIYYGKSPTEMFRLRGFNDALWKSSKRVDPSEWNSLLEPGTRYYWRVEVREDGRDKAYYGGSYPSATYLK